MRNPVQLARELGAGSFLVTQILFAGMVASALVHPLLVLTFFGVLAKIAWMGTVTRPDLILLIVSALNLVCGYVAFLVLGLNTLVAPERKHFGKIVLSTPPYWLLMSIAAVRSIWQLYRQPYLWEKTPHRPHRAVMASEFDIPPDSQAPSRLSPSRQS